MSKQPAATQGPADLLRVMSFVMMAAGIGGMAYLIANGYLVLGIASVLFGVFLFALGFTLATMAENAPTRTQQRQARPKLKL